MFKPRAAQQRILEYTSGKMGVSAVPGSGKTQTLSALAAKLIQTGHIGDDQEVLIVTLTNSAVDNFYVRISKMLDTQGIFPEIGFRVRTLHGLAHDIIRERPSLVGLSSQFQIIDEQEQELLINDAAFTWLRSHPEFKDAYIDSNLHPNERIRYRSQWQDLVAGIGFAFIRQSKDFQATPDTIRGKFSSQSEIPLLLQAGVEIYQQYQSSLCYRNAVDFDDLIMLALQALQTDAEYLARLQHRWPYILEDEAQDSSRLQEVILRLLTSKLGNWVRVGDPNQAIYETFTTANPRYLRNFLEEGDVRHEDLPQSGRSTNEILSLANELIHWTRNEHPVIELRSSLVYPTIQPTDPDDPQPNPVAGNHSISIHKAKLSPEEEIDYIVKSIVQWLPRNRQSTVAVLVPRNDRGAELAEALRRQHIEPVELLRSSPSTRQTVQVLSAALKHLIEPTSPQKLAFLFETLISLKQQSPEQDDSLRGMKRFLSRVGFTENLLYPSPKANWLNSPEFASLAESERNEVIAFIERVVRWHNAILLPVGKLIITLAQDLFDQPEDLALCHALAQTIEQDARLHPEWTMEDMVAQLDLIVENKRKFIGLSEDDSGFDPNAHPGKVVITTIHKAKGLEWDRVYILSVNNYDFPSVQAQDTYISEKFFVRERLNLQAEALALLKSLVTGESPPQEGIASQAARLDYSGERLRLLFVGITRARRELRITWNTGKRGNCLPAVPLLRIMDYLENAT